MQNQSNQSSLANIGNQINSANQAAQPFKLDAGETRVWVFGSSKPLQDQLPKIEARMSKFFSSWNAHGESVSGRWRLLFDRFLVVLREPEGAEVSGCSIDSMVGEVKLLEQELKTTLLDSSRIFYRDEEGIIHAVTRAEFKALAAQDAIQLDTEVFDTTLTSLSDMEVGVFNKKLSDSWHLRLFELAKKAQTA